MYFLVLFFIVFPPHKIAQHSTYCAIFEQIDKQLLRSLLHVCSSLPLIRSRSPLLCLAPQTTTNCRQSRAPKSSAIRRNYLHLQFSYKFIVVVCVRFVAVVAVRLRSCGCCRCLLHSTHTHTYTRLHSTHQSSWYLVCTLVHAFLFV